jgi:glycosyltransferase involved in cell wall biosynthesis
VNRPGLDADRGRVHVSVIVPARNAGKTLPDLLACLGEQTLERERYEVIVADDASRDRTAEVAERAGARVARAPRHRGSYAARNLGLDLARGESLAFTDADCRPARDWLERGLARLDLEGADMVSGPVEMRLGPRPTIGEMLSACADLNQGLFVWGGWGATANLFVDRRVFGRVGRFNDGLVSAGDLEFGLRAREAGFQIWYFDDIVVRHAPRRAAAVARKAFRTGIGQAQLVRGGLGPSRDPGMYRTRPLDLVPFAKWRGPWGTERLREAGYEPSWADLRRMEVASRLLGILPRAAGYSVGRIARR